MAPCKSGFRCCIARDNWFTWLNTDPPIYRYIVSCTGFKYSGWFVRHHTFISNIYLETPLTVIPLKIDQDLWHRKTSPGLPCTSVCGTTTHVYLIDKKKQKYSQTQSMSLCIKSHSMYSHITTNPQPASIENVNELRFVSLCALSQIASYHWFLMAHRQTLII